MEAEAAIVAQVQNAYYCSVNALRQNPIAPGNPCVLSYPVPIPHALHHLNPARRFLVEAIPLHDPAIPQVGRTGTPACCVVSSVPKDHFLPATNDGGQAVSIARIISAQQLTAFGQTSSSQPTNWNRGIPDLYPDHFHERKPCALCNPLPAFPLTHSV